jgi:ligand-binding SRPBCC domain-containing protein
MAVITLVTNINAPLENVFNLSRSIDLHQQTMAHTKEKAVDGVLSGYIEEGEFVTWEARHLFKKRRLTTKIVAMKFPAYFKDVMIKGDFNLMEHEHFFRETVNGTEMKDVFVFRSPYGLLGKVVDRLFLKTYLASC